MVLIEHVNNKIIIVVIIIMIVIITVLGNLTIVFLF
jgi:hypothetical protein